MNEEVLYNNSKNTNAGGTVLVRRKRSLLDTVFGKKKEIPVGVLVIPNSEQEKEKWTAAVKKSLPESKVKILESNEDFGSGLMDILKGQPPTILRFAIVAHGSMDGKQILTQNGNGADHKLLEPEALSRKVVNAIQRTYQDAKYDLEKIQYIEIALDTCGSAMSVDALHERDHPKNSYIEKFARAFFELLPIPELKVSGNAGSVYGEGENQGRVATYDPHFVNQELKNQKLAPSKDMLNLIASLNAYAHEGKLNSSMITALKDQKSNILSQNEKDLLRAHEAKILAIVDSIKKRDIAPHYTIKMERYEDEPSWTSFEQESIKAVDKNASTRSASGNDLIKERYPQESKERLSETTSKDRQSLPKSSAANHNSNTAESQKAERPDSKQQNSFVLDTDSEINIKTGKTRGDLSKNPHTQSHLSHEDEDTHMPKNDQQSAPPKRSHSYKNTAISAGLLAFGGAGALDSFKKGAVFEGVTGITETSLGAAGFITSFFVNKKDSILKSLSHSPKMLKAATEIIKSANHFLKIIPGAGAIFSLIATQKDILDILEASQSSNNKEVAKALVNFVLDVSITIIHLMPGVGTLASFGLLGARLTTGLFIDQVCDPEAYKKTWALISDPESTWFTKAVAAVGGTIQLVFNKTLGSIIYPVINFAENRDRADKMKLEEKSLKYSPQDIKDIFEVSDISDEGIRVLDFSPLGFYKKGGISQC